jgi:hypothetical protein
MRGSQWVCRAPASKREEKMTELTYEQKRAQEEAIFNKLMELADIVTADLEEQIEWHRRHGSDASQDRLIALAEKHVSEVYEHRAEKAEAEGNEAIALGLDLLQRFVPACVQKLRMRK